MANPLEHQLSYPFGDQLPATGSTLEIAPGVRWVRMGLPFALDHINLWLLRDREAGPDGREGWAVVDCGITSDLTRQAWEQIFAEGLDGLPVLRVIVTHMHGMGQTLQKDAHAAQGLVDRLRHEGVNTLVDLFLILAGHRPGSRYQGANKALEERQVSRRRIKLERVEPGALAHLEGQVATAQRADKHL